MSLRDLAGLVLLGAIWGASFLFIRVAAPAVGPALLMELRVLLAGLALLACVVALRLPVGALRSRWKQFLVLGTLNAAVPFTLIAASELHIPAGLAAILNSTTPIWTAIVSALRLGEAFPPRRILGLGLGVVGVATLMGWSPVPLTLKVVLAVGASLLAAVFYAFGSVYAARMSRDVPPLVLAVGQQLGAATVLLPLAGATLPDAWPGPAAVYSILGLSFLCTAVAYLIYFPLIARVGPTRTLSVTYLVPVSGILWGAIFLGEPITPGMVGGLVLILVSVLFVTDVRARAARSDPARAAAPGTAASRLRG
ncbi:DMT family transporter [Caldinitratiruptor microaerophilus]|uniref:Multidrug DMT transporter permease n=1 Tax=Caldinitratiruptor microaerophilus TaxID=671077 RepID=A0AA35CL45_9FIRM|nr:DMT family transporter [Caldinitratiruptor microaerophilus]BDG60413.1 multidrug DMT transporter permease [Caldinitratiruptor microaerophilus]